MLIFLSIQFATCVLYLFVVPVVWEALHDEVVDAVERGLLLGGVLYGHGDEGDVGVGRLHHVLGRAVLGHPVVGRVGRAHVPAHGGSGYRLQAIVGIWPPASKFGWTEFGGCANIQDYHQETPIKSAVHLLIKGGFCAKKLSEMQCSWLVVEGACSVQVWLACKTSSGYVIFSH